MEVREALKYARDRLTVISETPQLDAEVLLAEVLDTTRIWLVAHDNDLLTEEQKRAFHKLVQRRESGEPVAYILERREFFGRDFFVSPAVLVPRPETELLVERALDFLKTLPSGGRVLDLGTGSGCIVVSLALYLKQKGFDFEFFAIEKSQKALEVAQKNANVLGASTIHFLQGDWFDGVGDLTFDCIISNPPYVDEAESIGPSLQFEPKEALFAPDAGLGSILHIIKEAKKFLRSDGKLFLECGKGQGELLRNLPELWSDWKMAAHRDLQGIERVIEVSR